MKRPLLTQLNGFLTGTVGVAVMIVIFMTFGSSKASAQCQNINLACNDEIHVTIGENCISIITVDMILEDPPFDVFPDEVHGNYDIVLKLPDGTELPGDYVTDEHVGQLIEVTITLLPCSISCWGYITVEDKIPPVFEDCEDGYLPPVDIDCEAYINNHTIPEPNVTGFCNGPRILTFEDDTSSLNCENGYVLTILRTWTASDAFGNTSSCKQEIQVEKFLLKNVVFPPNFVYNPDSEGNCSAFDPANFTPDGLENIHHVQGYPIGAFCPNIQFYYNDINFPQCGVQLKILRDWFVIDWCTGQSLSKGQVIKAIDDNPALTSCPADTLLFNTFPGACYAIPVLDPYGLYEDIHGDVVSLTECSQPVHISVEYLPAEPGTDQPQDVPYIPVPINVDSTFTLPIVENVMWVRYCFTDACNNSSTIDPTEDDGYGAQTTGCCYFEVGIQDGTPPTAICEGYTAVPLDEYGLVEVFAETFDDHSFDPCGDISHFEVRRETGVCPGNVNDLTFGPSVHFCCNDIGDELTVRLRAYDVENNYSECLARVTITDGGTPLVYCPDSPVTLPCTVEDPTDRNLIGVPTGAPGCGNIFRISNEQFDYTYFDPSCNIGTIIRTFDVRDGNNKFLRECIQTIVVESDSDDALTQGDFQFPGDITLDICSTSGSTHPDDTGKPIATRNFNCLNIAISYEDDFQYVSNTSGYCSKIFREWRVIDWCQYSPTQPYNHILTHTQVIHVENTGSPIFTAGCEDIVVTSTGSNCEAFVPVNVTVEDQCTSNPVDVIWHVDLFDDGSDFDYTGAGVNASGTYPVGTHKITFEAWNSCGNNTSKCTFYIVVRGEKPPTPICLGHVVWTLDNNGEATVWAVDFDIKSEGGCDGEDDLTFSFVPPTHPNFPEIGRTFTCAHLPNGVGVIIPLEMYVVDEVGNYESCTVDLELQDNKDICQDSSNGAQVSGQIVTEYAEGLGHIDVMMKEMTEHIETHQETDDDGSFLFENMNHYHGYQLKPQKNDVPMNGVSTLDLVLIQKHILGEEQLNSPYKLIAADINRSNSVTAIDLVELRKMILGIYEEFPNSESWVFVPGHTDFPDPEAPWGFSNDMTFENLYVSYEGANFTGVKTGDVNNSVKLVGIRDNHLEERSVASTTLVIRDKFFDQDESLNVQVRSNGEIHAVGMQVAIEYDHHSLTFAGLLPGHLKVRSDQYAVDTYREGLIVISYDNVSGDKISEGANLFDLIFTAKSDGRLSESLRISQDELLPEFYTRGSEIASVDLVFDDEGRSAREFEVYQNEPNPFDETTKIGFYLPADEVVKLTIIDSQGRIIFNTSDYFSAGNNAFIVSQRDLSAYGVMFYRVETSKTSSIRKMIMVK